MLERMKKKDTAVDTTNNSKNKESTTGESISLNFKEANYITSDENQVPVQLPRKRKL